MLYNGLSAQDIQKNLPRLYSVNPDSEKLEGDLVKAMYVYLNLGGLLASNDYLPPQYKDEGYRAAVSVIIGMNYAEVVPSAVKTLDQNKQKVKNALMALEIMEYQDSEKEMYSVIKQVVGYAELLIKQKDNPERFAKEEEEKKKAQEKKNRIEKEQKKEAEKKKEDKGTKEKKNQEGSPTPPSTPASTPPVSPKQVWFAGFKSWVLGGTAPDAKHADATAKEENDKREKEKKEKADQEDREKKEKAEKEKLEKEQKEKADNEKSEKEQKEKEEKEKADKKKAEKEKAEKEQKEKEGQEKAEQEKNKKAEGKDGEGVDKGQPPKAKPWNAPKWPTNSEANKFMGNVLAQASSLKAAALKADAKLVFTKADNLGFMKEALLEKVAAGVPATDEGNATKALLKQAIEKAFEPMLDGVQKAKPTLGDYKAPAGNKDLEKAYKALSSKRDVFSKKFDALSKNKGSAFDINLSVLALESIEKCFKACGNESDKTAAHLKSLDAELAMLELADQMASFGAMGNSASLQASRHAVRAATTVAGAAVGSIAAGGTMFALSADVIALEGIKASLMNKRFELAAQQIVGLMQQTAPQFLLIIGACAAVGGVGMLLAATLSPMSEAINGIGDTAKFKTALEHLVGNVAAAVNKGIKPAEVGK